MGNRYGFHSGTITAQNMKCKGDLTINDDIIFSDVSAGALGVTGGIDMTGTTSAIGINLTGATISGDDIALSSTGVINAATSITQEINGTAQLALTSGVLTLSDPVNLVLGTTTGTKIGTAIDQKLGFYNATPIIQRASADQAAAPAGGTGATEGAYDTAAHRDALITLVNEMRTVLVNLGLMKGSA